MFVPLENIVFVNRYLKSIVALPDKKLILYSDFKQNPQPIAQFMSHAAPAMRYISLADVDIFPMDNERKMRRLIWGSALRFQTDWQGLGIKKQTFGI